MLMYSKGKLNNLQLTSVDIAQIVYLVYRGAPTVRLSRGVSSQVQYTDDNAAFRIIPLLSLLIYSLIVLFNFIVFILYSI